MILKELQNFVLKYHRVSLAELDIHFARHHTVSPSALLVVDNNLILS